MNKCTRCGTMTDGAFCPKCGGPTVAEAVPAPQVIVNTPVQRTITKDDLPEQYQPLSAWAYWGLSILFSIPVVGFVFLIVFSISGSNINRRSYARSYWIWAVICVVLTVVAVIIIALTVGFSGLGEKIMESLK
ncbi:MAG: hypothetical protein J5854_07565 [Clostridia bacterium]|nr:hypothetical protein [Clostridia bacterium]